MAKNKVYIEIEVNGKMQKVAVQAAKLKTALEGVEAGGRTADRALKGAANTSSNATKNFSKMSQGLTGTLVPAYATLAAQLFAVSAAFQFLKEAGNLDNLRKGQIAYAGATGTAMGTITKNIIAATDAQLGFQDAAQGAAIGTAAGLSADQLAKIGKAARDSSFILGRDLTDSYNRLLRGITKAEPELLDELGIILRLDTATKNYKDAMGITTRELTTFEKTQAVANETLGQAEEKYGKILEIVEAQANPFAKLGKTVDVIGNNLKEMAVTVLGPIAEAFAKTPELMYIGLAALLKGPIVALLPALTDMGTRTEQFAARSKTSFENASKDARRYALTLKASQGESADVLKELEKMAAADAQSLLKKAGVNDNRKSIAALIAGDAEKISKQHITNVKKMIANGDAAFDNLSNKQKKQLLETLDDMQVAQTSSAGKITKTTATWTAKGKGYILSFKATAVGAFAAIGRAAAAAGAFIQKAFVWLQVATAAYAAFTVVKDMFFSVADGAGESEKAISALSEKLQSVNKDFQKFVEIQKVITEDGAGMGTFVSSLGNYIGSLNVNELALATQEFGKMADQLGATVKITESMTTHQKEMAEAQARATSGTYTYSTYTNYVKVATEQADNGVKNLNISLFEYIKTSDDASDITKNFIEYLEAQEAAIANLPDSLRYASKATVEYYNAIQALKNNEEGAPERLQAASEAYKNLGKAQTEAARQAIDNARDAGKLFQDFVPETKYDALLSNLKAEEKNLQELIKDRNTLDDETGKGYLARLDAIREERDLAKQLNELSEARLKREMAIQKLEIERALDGNTSGQMARLKVEFDILKKQEEQKKVQEDIDMINQKVQERGTPIQAAEQRAIDLNKEKLNILQLQEDVLRQQEQTYYQLEMAAKNTIESSLGTNLADIIKGKQNSFTDAIRNIAVATLESIADVLAKKLTDKSIDFLFGEVSPEKKMQGAITTALKEGGDYVAARISGAMGTSDASITSTSTSTPSAVLAAANPVQPSTDKKKGFWSTLWGSSGNAGENQAGKVVTEGVGKGLEEVPVKGPSGLVGLFNNFTANMKGLFDGEAPFLENLGTLFSGLGTDLSGIFGTLMDGIGGLFGGGGVAGGGGILAGLGSLFFANGGYAQGGFRAFANGGMVNKPTIGLVGEGKYNEAVVPLPDGNRIPVEMKGAGNGGTNNVTVNVSMDGTQSSSSNSKQGQDLGAIIASAVQKELQNQKRSGGILNPYGAS